jgi:hypothetical protein
MTATLARLLIGFALACPASAASANVIADWDAKAVGIIGKSTPAPLSQREVALVNIAMFERVNAIDRRYRPFLVEAYSGADDLAEAAAAVAAATMLTAMHPEASDDIKAMLASYFSGNPGWRGQSRGTKLGEASKQNSPARERWGDGSGCLSAEHQSRPLRSDADHSRGGRGPT